MSGSHYLGALKSLLTTMTTLGIPSFYASRWNRFSLMNQTTQGLEYFINTWKALRVFSMLMMGSMLAALLNANAHTGTFFWFTSTCSALSAAISLTTSTLLIIYFSQYSLGFDHENDNAGRFFVWDIWDLCAAPAVWSLWAFIALIASIISAIADPSILQNNFSNQPLVSPRSLPAPDTTWTSVTALRILLTAMTCSALLALTLTILHLRRISHLQPV